VLNEEVIMSEKTLKGHALIGNKRWTIILPAVFIMYTISFFDRVNIGMALPHITAEMGLSPVEAGWLGGAFAWVTSPRNLPQDGWLFVLDHGK
jgi:sugar phosphate permease